MMFAYPYFARHKNDREWVRKYYCLITFSMCLLNVFVVAGGVLLAQPIITIVFGSVYLDAVKPFQILMVGYFFGTFQSIAGNLLVTQRKLKFNLLLGILGAVSGMVFNVVLIPQMLSIGTALSHVLTKVLLSIVSTVYFLKIVRKIPEK